MSFRRTYKICVMVATFSNYAHFCVIIGILATLILKFNDFYATHSIEDKTLIQNIPVLIDIVSKLTEKKYTIQYCQKVILNQN